MSAGEDRDQFPLRGQTYDMAMRMVRDMRRLRVAVAARDAIGLARELNPGRPRTILRDPGQGDPMWELRGEPRTRATFSQPHPGDFPGGLRIPPECPDLPA